MIVRLLSVFSTILALVLVLVWPVSAGAETISLQPVADTTLIQGAPLNNLGGAGFFNAGTAGNGNQNRGLILFDLGSAVPAGAVIMRAELTLDVVRQPSSDRQNSDFVLRRMLQSWGEGAQVPADGDSPGQGAAADADETTWRFRFATSVPWSQPGGQAGVDFANAISSSAFVSGAGEQVTFASTPALVADLQWWMNHPEANFGWMLNTASEDVSKTARSFASRESGFGPTLTLDFVAVPEPSARSLIGLFLVCAAVAVGVRSSRNSPGFRKRFSRKHREATQR
jgi:hypothetical protein